MPTVGHFIAEFAEQTFALQGQLWRTLYSLLLEPGALTLEYVAGRRQRYVRPLRLYLAMSILFFAVLGLSGNSGFIRFGDADDSAEPAAEAGPSGSAAAKPTADPGAPRGTPVPVADPPDANPAPSAAPPKASEDFNGLTLDTGFPEFDARVRKRFEHLRELPKDELGERIFEAFTGWAPVAMFVLMPLFAAFLKLGYLGRGAHYAVHLLFAVNFHSYIFLTLLLLQMPLVDPLAALLSVGVPLHLWIALRRVHGGGALSTALFVVLLAMVYIVAMALVMALATMVPLALL